MTRKSSENLASIQTKYIDKNPLVRYANRRFLESIESMIMDLNITSVLDAGCGEAIVMKRINAVQQLKSVIGVDFDIARLIEAKSRLVSNYAQADIHNLPFYSNQFDLVLCMEVFEHLGDPEGALQEISKVTRRYLLTSVPNEPWWRIANMARLKYLSEWGNTPEHINHWSIWGFKRFISKCFRIVRVETPVLWTFILAEKITT